MRRKDAELMLAILLDDADLGRTDAFVDTIEFVGMTPAVAITTTGASRPVSTALWSSAKRTRRSTALSGGTILRRS
jgi:hypothetical protein